jgi:hypothetical protein
VPLLRVAIFAAALAFVTVDIHWTSQHFLPWAVRVAGVVGIAILSVAVRWEGIAGAFRRWAGTAERHPGGVVNGLAAAAFVLTVALAYFVHQPYPHVPDGFSYYFQAKIFAEGKLFETAPPLPEFFRFDWVAIHDGRWFSIFPPGWPLLLAAGIKAGVPALVNPVLGAICVIVIWRLGTALFGPRTGLLSALFCCLSPFFLFMSSEFMSHTAALLFTSMATLAYVSARSAKGGLGGYAVSGAAAGLAFLIRPADATAIWAAQTVHGLWVDRSRRAVLGACLSAVPLACGAAVYLAYNRVLMGRWLSSPLLLVSPRNRMGFGADIGYDWAFETPGHTPWRAVLNLNHNAAVMSQDLFGWPITSLFFVLVLACFGRKDSRHGLCGLIIAAFVVLYGLYWYHGEAFGARFYFTLLPSVLMLTVEGIRQTPEILTRRLPSAGITRLSRVTAAAVTLCFTFGWAVYVPKASLIAPYYNQKGVNSAFYEFQRRERLDRAIVFVQAPEPLHYGPAFIANDLPIGSGSVIYAIDRGETDDQALAAMFPDRSVHRFIHERRPNPIRIWLQTHIRDGW